MNSYSSILHDNLFWIIGFLFSVIIVLSSISVYILYIFNPDELVSIAAIAVNLLSVIMSSLLTFILVYLYYQMANISERQVKLEEAQNKPQIFIKDVEFEEDQVMINIVNEGMGIAKNFHLRCDAYVDTGEIFKEDDHLVDILSHSQHGFEFSSFDSLLARINVEKDVDEYTALRRAMDRQIGGAEILKSQNSGWYYSPLSPGWMVSDESNPDRSTLEPLSKITERMNKIGIDRICFQISLVFLDINNNINMRILFNKSIDTTTKQTLEEAQKQRPENDIKGGCSFDKHRIIQKVDIDNVSGSY